MEMPVLNDEQRNAAFCTNNAVIAAGAGSGKTMVLASRYAWLITEKKYRVREILTLTFTKKAAAQMYRRIHLLLANIAKKESGQKKELAEKALDEFAEARIQTLDSYCAAVVKQAANRYGIRADFINDDERCNQLALDEALPFLIANRNHPAIKLLYPRKSHVHIANDIFALALFQLTYMDSPPNPERDFNSQCAVICREWERLSGIIHGKLNDLKDIYPGNEQYHPDLGPLLSEFMAGNIIFPDIKKIGSFFRELVSLPHRQVVEWAQSQPIQKEIDSILKYVLSLTALNLGKGQRSNNPAKEILYEIRDLYGEFSSLGIFIIQAGFIYPVLALLSELQYRYLDKKRTEGILTFGDIARLSRKILLEQPDIRQSEKESFKSIMIDEFQDNNELQKDLLFLLAEKDNVMNNSVPLPEDLSPGKLFFVGDEKQSIYKFRGADVSVFRKLKDELVSAELPLKINYRSSPLLIGAFNAIFGGSKYDPDGNSPFAENPAVFAPEPLPPYEASFSPLKAFKTGEGKLTLSVLDIVDSDEFYEGEDTAITPVENEARYVAEQIKDLLCEKDNSGKNKYQPEDMAILFQNRTNQHLFEKHLLLLNIPYICEDLNGFFFGGPVNDLMSVLRLAAYPMDRAAYAQMLRSPFAGLSMAGLSACIEVLIDDSSPEPFDDAPLALLSGADREKYCHGQRIYQKMLGMANTESICFLLSELWYGEGYRYETGWNQKTAAYRDLYDYLFHLAAAADEKSQTLASFTDYIYELSKSGERLNDIEIPLERSGAVHLMTIHKSKGLEFPVVFLCCCNKKGRNNYFGDIFETDEWGIALNPPLPPGYEDNKNNKRNYFWERSSADETGKSTAELRRLLYVGMTRAENELYLSGCLGISKELGLDVTAQEDKAFPLQLKMFIESKMKKAKGKNSIPFDNILEGNTFFGLCLPAIAANIKGENPETAGDASSAEDAAFLTVKKIPVLSEQYIRNAEQHGSGFTNDQKGLNAFFEKALPFYNGCDIIETPIIPKNRFTPTSLPFSGDPNLELPIDFENSGCDALDVFVKVDKLLARYEKSSPGESEKFDSRSFGTIAHACVEAALCGREASIPPKLAGFLSPEDADAFLEAGKKLALRFIQSPLGIKAGNAEKRYSEFPFRSLIYSLEGAAEPRPGSPPEGNEIFITGTIDLIFTDKDDIYVVDFKTDSHELPGQHIAQMASYYRAALDLFSSPAAGGAPQLSAPMEGTGKECRVWLYYLRTGHAVDVTEAAKKLV